MDRINRTGTGIASLGRDEDQFLAHVALGERVVPPVISAATQARINQEMRAAGLDPNEYAVGSGMSINPITGLPEFGFFKKAFKSIKKVAKKVAPIAAFVPGVGTALGGVLGGIGGLATKIPGIGGALGSLGSTVAGGIANLGIPGISSIAGGATGGFANIGKGLGSLEGLLGGGPLSGFLGEGASTVTVQPGDTLSDIAAKNNTTVEAIMKANPGITDPNLIQAGANLTIPGKTGFNVANLFSGGQQQQQLFDAQGNPVQQSSNLLGNLFGGGGGFGGGLASAGLGGFLGKLAYDAAKDRAGGLAVTPQVSMDALGRYQLASDLGTGGTRGQFGLGPKPAVLDVAGMGRQPFAAGGIAELDLREGGESIGPGTGTSDDIPAMLSDGEFVMTAKATRGAGAYDMKKNKSGIELVKSGSQSREKGVQNMRELMNIFESM